MDPALAVPVKDFIEREGLPDDYLETVEKWFMPLAEELLRRISGHRGTFVIGISGSQGSGKSTLAALLVVLFREMAGLRSVNLSLDDFYLTRQQRRVLARDVHPLLETRGVPGTHDVELAINTLRRLQEHDRVPIPRFDKARDDRLPEPDWPLMQAPLDVVILEGWCLGVEPQEEAALEQPVNALESREDGDGAWRHYVNRQLGGPYQRLSGQLDLLVMLRAPDFESVFRWRRLQESKLAAKSQPGGGAGGMDDAALATFIQHYERLTRHALATLEDRADIVFELDQCQNVQDKH